MIYENDYMVSGYGNDDDDYEFGNGDGYGNGDENNSSIGNGDGCGNRGVYGKLVNNLLPISDREKLRIFLRSK